MDDDDRLREAAAEGRQTAEALGALEAWLLAEDAYVRGGVPDQLLTYLQDHIDRLLGPRATSVAGEFLRERIGPDGDLAGLAGDRDAMLDLLARIEGKRRRGFEYAWRAFPPALLVMAEYGVDDPVWERPHGSGSPISLTDYGVPDPVIQGLRAWNAEYGRSLHQENDSPTWIERGLKLAHDLQKTLPTIDVRYYHADDDRPLRSI